MLTKQKLQTLGQRVLTKAGLQEVILKVGRNLFTHMSRNLGLITVLEHPPGAERSAIEVQKNVPVAESPRISLSN